MANFVATILVENSTVENVINALGEEFKMTFSENGVGTSFGMLIQVWQTPKEFLNYETQILDDSDESENFYQNFDISGFTVSVDISRPSLTVVKYLSVVMEILASGLSVASKKRVLLINKNDLSRLPTFFEKGNKM